MRLGILGGPLLVFLYQAVPVHTEPDSLGRYRLSVGYGAGRFEADQFDCDGNVSAASPVGWRAGGGELDAWPDPRLRVSAFASSIASDSLDHRGLAAGVVVAREGQRFGIGGGLVHGGGSNGGNVPSVYLRVGSIDGAHVRFDGYAPSPSFGTTGWARLGVGFNQGHRRGVSGLFGVSACPYCEEKINLGAFGEIAVPTARGLDVTLHGRIGPGHQLGERTVGGGIRYSFGR